MALERRKKQQVPQSVRPKSAVRDDNVISGRQKRGAGPKPGATKTRSCAAKWNPRTQYAAPADAQAQNHHPSGARKRHL